MEIIEVLKSLDALDRCQLRAGNITVGTQLAEADGFLWDVTEVIKSTDATITARLNGDWSSYRCHWTGNKGIVKTFHKCDWLVGTKPG